MNDDFDAELQQTPLGQTVAGNIKRLKDRIEALEKALREIETICTESAGDCRKRMGTRVGNTIVAVRAALAPEQDK